MWVAAAASWSDFPFAVLAERSASPMVLSGNPPRVLGRADLPAESGQAGTWSGAILVTGRSGQQRPLHPGTTRSPYPGSLLAHDLSVAGLTAPELLQFLDGHEHVARLGALGRPHHAALLELVHDAAGAGG